jgi:Ca2+-binding RTX toxin-like protein
MPTYQLTEPSLQPGAVTLSCDHFGVNVVTSYDQEFAQPESGLADLVAEMSASTLRFPGGSATERYFDMTRPNSMVSAHPDAPDLTPMDGFFAEAGRIGADVQIVVPTRVGFRDSAIEALRAGTYGQRDVLDSTYLADMETFVRTAFAQAAANGVAITGLEIGNEFWGSGEMTAGEYGFVAARVALQLEAILQDLGVEDTVRIAAQSTAAASDIYAPRNDVSNFIDASNGFETLRSQAYVNKHFGGTVPADYEPVTIPGQGSAAAQLNSIVTQINALPGAADAIDGVILHYYQRKGLAGVDGGRAYTFNQLQNFEDRLHRSEDAPPMTYHITEWNAATGNHPDNAGLRHASMLIETLYEMATNKVTDTQIWPLTFNAAQGTSMVDLNDGRLSIAGQMFRLMAESLPGLDPVLDWSIDGQIDVHGFTSESRAALFISERSGQTQLDAHLSTGALLGDCKYVITMTELWDGGAGGDKAGAASHVTFFDGYTGAADTLDFDIRSWANLRIELTEVGWKDDIVRTYNGNDRIYTYGGDDVIEAGAGDDYIHAGEGADEVWGGAGNDMIVGHHGNDRLHGGAGRDVFVFETGDGDDIIGDFTFGPDRFEINGQRAYNFTTLLAIEGVGIGVAGGHVHITYGAGDTILLSSSQPTLADAAGGKFTGTHRTDIFIGSDAQDDLRGYNGADYFVDGGGRDFMRGGNGADYFVLVRDGERDVITDFQPDRDRIDLTAWEIAQFSDLDISVEYHLNGDWAGFGYIRYQDEVLRLDGMDDAMLVLLDSDVIAI